MKKIFVLLVALFVHTASAEDVYWFSDGVYFNKSTCASGDDIITPDGPYKYGHRFVNWEPATQYDMTTLDTTENSTNYVTANSQWRVAFSYGTVLGVSLCQSITQDQFIAGAVLNPDSPGGKNCYCRVIGFIPSGETDVYQPLISVWGFARTGYYDYNAGNDNCRKNCLPNCAQYVATTPSLRSTIYGMGTN